jgi:YYY domain-containing protein
MEFTPIIIWWLLLFVIGLVGWPLAFSLLRFLPDRGFAVARPAGFLLTGYLLWLGATFRLLQNSAGGVLASLGLVLLGGLWWHRQQVRAGRSEPMLAWLKREWRYVVSVELLFAAAFLGWVFYKAYNPNIETAGGEKWMEIAFVNGILRSDYFPPKDPWLSGFGISYYYFGYVMMAAVTRLSGIVSTTAFNLYIPTLFGMTLVGALGVVANMVALYQKNDRPNLPDQPLSEQAFNLSYVSLSIGLLGALCVGLLGNLSGLLEVLHKRGLLAPGFWAWLDLRDLREPPVPSESWIPDRFIWWWRGSRVLTDYNLLGQEQEVIDEFPFFSFLLGDVHPHVLSLPFVLLVTALALNLLISPARPTRQLSGGGPFGQVKSLLKHSWQELIAATGGKPAFVLYALAIGGLSFLNTWDLPIYLSVVGLVLIVRLAQQREHWAGALLPGVMGTGLLAIAGVLLYLPFYATFQSQARGLLPNLWNPTRLPQFFIFFGPFLVAVTALLAAMSNRRRAWQRPLGWTLPLTLLGPVVLLLLIVLSVLINPAGRDYLQGILANPEIQTVIGGSSLEALLQEAITRRVSQPWTFLLLGGLLGWALALGVGLLPPLIRRDEASSRSPVWDTTSIERFVLILLSVGLSLPLVVEFVYLRDNFGTRMNTIFKFYFQAWVLLALVSAFALYYVSKNLSRLPALLFLLIMGALVAAGLVYPVLATLDRANYFRHEPTLNGIEWVAQFRPADYAALQWLRANAPQDAVLLEAPGSGYAAYQYTGRVSALTGIPTLLGWGGHQSQWRGNYDEPGRREPEIETIYNTPDPGQALALLQKYGVDYVYIGALERERYSPQGLNKFAQFLPVAFQQDEVAIYSVP